MAHAQALEPEDSRYAPWVPRLIVVSVVLAVLTILLSLTDGMVGKALPFGIGSLAFAVAAVIVAQAVKVHRTGAMVALIVGFVGFASGLQSALLGTGQIN